MDKIERIRTTHGCKVGDGKTSDVNGDGFDVIQYCRIPMNDNDNVKLLNEYDRTDAYVYDDIDNSNLTGSTSDYFPGASVGWYPSGPPEGWRPWAHTPKTREPKFFPLIIPAIGRN